MIFMLLTSMNRVLEQEDGSYRNDNIGLSSKSDRITSTKNGKTRRFNSCRHCCRRATDVISDGKKVSAPGKSSLHLSKVQPSMIMQSYRWRLSETEHDDIIEAK